MNPAPLNTDAPFTEGDIARFNRFTHFPKDRDRENARFAEQSRQERTQAKQILKGHGKTEMPEDVERALERLRKARYQVFMASVRSREIAPPWSVVGPARYAEHANPDRAHRMMGRAFEELNNARAALARRLNQHGPSPVIRSDNATAVQLLEARIAAAQRHQEKMKRANAILRDQGTDESWKISRLEAGVTGMRARELVDLNICHVRFMRPFTVTILGKGRKERVCPLWRETMDALRDCLGPRAARPTEATPLFLNVHGARLTRFGVRYIVADREGAAARAHPSLQTRRVPRIGIQVVMQRAAKPKLRFWEKPQSIVIRPSLLEQRALRCPRHRITIGNQCVLQVRKGVEAELADGPGDDFCHGQADRRLVVEGFPDVAGIENQ